jgi:NodT family efflux transporter outer membrane factor (OMF) lipoprotein
MIRLFPLLVLATLLNGCVSVGPDYQTPDSGLPLRHRDAGTHVSRAPPQIDRWWTLFKDPILNRLVDRALAQNLDLAAADARIQQSRASARTALANRLPSAQGSGFANVQRDSREASGNPSSASGASYRLYSGQLDASWELDLFGGLRRAQTAASRDLDAAEANFAATRVSLVAEIADTYVRLRALQERLAQARATVVAQQDAVSLSRSRFQAGLVSELDVAQAEALLADFRAVIPGLQTDIQDRRNQIAQLVGTIPAEVAADLNPHRSIPATPVVPGIGVPSDLLRRRPDIIEAERRAAAASERIGQQVAEYFPKISLLGTLGLQSRDVATLFTGGAGLISAGPSIQWRLLDFARIDAEVARAEGVEKERLALYRAAILTAMKEVDTGLVRLRGGTQEQTVRARSVAAQVRARDIARDQYTRGLTQLLPVLDAQRRVNDAQDALIRAREVRATAAIALFKALGGGWQPLKPVTLPAVRQAAEYQPRTEATGR